MASQLDWWIWIASSLALFAIFIFAMWIAHKKDKADHSQPHEYNRGY